MTEREEQLRIQRDKINNYVQTVNAIISFIGFSLYDGNQIKLGSKYGIGRRMTTSSENSISPESDISPDIIIQRSDQYGLVVEVKKSIAQSSLGWETHSKRLRKYDDKLVGWWTPNEFILYSDTVLLIHQSRSREFTWYLNDLKKQDSAKVGKNTCITEFSQSDETVTYCSLRLEFGNLSDQDLNDQLSRGVQVPLDPTRMSFPNIQFYDGEPPLPLLLLHLWQGVFSSRIEDGEFDAETKSTKIKISVAEATTDLQRAFGSRALPYQDDRSQEFPKKRRVKQAFERLLKYRLAIPCSGEDDYYLIFYKSFRGDVKEQFIKYELSALKKKEGKEPPIGEQKNLLNGLDNGEPT